MPELISHYEVLETLGTGGMGTVHRARDTRDGRVVALKLLHPHLAADAEYLRRFQREARIAATIDSPHVIRVLDVGNDGQRHFLVMEYVAGRTLAQQIHQEGRLLVDETVRVATAVASGLAAAHALGIVHRDVSPQNVMLGADGSIKLTDFGVARDLGATAMTATSMLLGKPQYIAPEVVTGASPVDIRSDIYALGVVIYQMLTGPVPFHGETPYAVMQAQVHHEPPPVQRVRADVPGWFAGILERCLAKKAEVRYQEPEGLLSDLNNRRAPTGSFRASVSRKEASRRIVLLAGAGGLMIAAIVLGAVAFAGGGDSKGASADDSGQVIAPALTNTPPPTATVRPLPTATAPPAVPPVLNRMNCTVIRNDPGGYLSDEERSWFLANCNTPPPTQPPVGPGGGGSSSNPPPTVSAPSGPRTVTVSLCNPSGVGILLFKITSGSFTYTYDASVSGLNLPAGSLPSSLQVPNVPPGNYQWQANTLSRSGGLLQSYFKSSDQSRIVSSPFC